MILVVSFGSVATAIVSESEESVEDIRLATEEVLERSDYTGFSQNPLGRLMQDNPITRWINDVWQRFLDWLFGLGGERDPSQPSTQQDPGRSAAGPWVIALAVATAAVVAVFLVRSREDREGATVRRLADERAKAADELERLADEAELAGDFESSVRLRFQGGLTRLDDSGTIDVGPSVVTGTVRRSLELDEFDDVASAFEVSAYSDRETSRNDAATARQGWSEVFGALAVADDQGDQHEEDEHEKDQQ